MDIGPVEKPWRMHSWHFWPQNGLLDNLRDSLLTFASLGNTSSLVRDWRIEGKRNKQVEVKGGSITLWSVIMAWKEFGLKVTDCSVRGKKCLWWKNIPSSKHTVQETCPLGSFIQGSGLLLYPSMSTTWFAGKQNSRTFWSHLGLAHRPASVCSKHMEYLGTCHMEFLLSGICRGWGTWLWVTRRGYQTFMGTSEW